MGPPAQTPAPEEGESALLPDARTREILGALKARAGEGAVRGGPGVLGAGFVLEPWERDALKRGGGAVSAAADQYAAWLGALLAVRLRADELTAEEFTWRAGSPGLPERAAEARKLLAALEASIPALDHAKQALGPQVGSSRIKQLEQTEMGAFRAALALRGRVTATGVPAASLPLAALQTAEDRFKLPRAPLTRVRAAAVAVAAVTPLPLRWALLAAAIVVGGWGAYSLYDRLSAPSAREIRTDELRALSTYLGEGWAPTRPGIPLIAKVRLEWDDLPDERKRAEADAVAKALPRFGTKSAVVYRPHMGVAFQIVGGKVVSLR